MRWHRRVRTSVLRRGIDGAYRSEITVDYVIKNEVVNRTYYPQMNWTKLAAEAYGFQPNEWTGIEI